VKSVMEAIWEAKARVSAELAPFMHDPEALIRHLAPFQETSPEHQRLQPVKPRPRPKAPAYKPFAPTSPPKAYWKK